MLQVVSFSKYLNESLFSVISTDLVKVSVRTEKSELFYGKVDPVFFSIYGVKRYQKINFGLYFENGTLCSAD